jgi:hypothetical protein
MQQKGSVIEFSEYLNDQAYLTEAKKKQFKITHPSDKKIEKTFISKSEISWLQKLEVVAKGVSCSFRLFAETVSGQIEKDNLSITEGYYKHVIARVIMFRSLEKMISAADWYDGGFRAQTVTYSMAYLSYIISKSERLTPSTMTSAIIPKNGPRLIFSR